MSQILIAEDDKVQQRMLSKLIKSQLGHDCICVENGRHAVEIMLGKDGPDIKLIMLDIEMPVLNGFETLDILQQKYPFVPIIMLTGSTEIANAVRAVKAGALDYLTKPIEANRFILTLRNALNLGDLKNEVTRLQRNKKNHFSFSELIGHDNGLKSAVLSGKKAAGADIPVLLMGPTGSGKEVFARAIHGESTRRDMPFIAINCGAIPTQLVESTLFGHEKGSFTGATEKTLGKFREAESGTVFLDEIGELPLEVQVKLLRVLQQKEVEPVGGGKPVPANIRILSATNRNLQDAVNKGLFREDLYYRLNVLEIHLPKLSERPNDIPALAQHFITRFCAQYGLPHISLSPEAELSLMQREWRGNVRELENVMNRALVLREGLILNPRDLLAAISERTPCSKSDPLIFQKEERQQFKTMQEIEYEAMQAALQAHGNNITQAAKSLGIAKSTFYRKLGEAAVDIRTTKQ